MRLLSILALTIILAACGNENTDDNNTPVSDSTQKADSLKKDQAEQDISEEVIHSKFNELNRDALGR